MSVAINISLKVDDVIQRALPASETMDSVNLLLEAAGKHWTLGFSRVPVPGENISIKGAGLYRVRSVTHTPHSSYVAKLEIELVEPEI